MFTKAQSWLWLAIGLLMLSTWAHADTFHHGLLEERGLQGVETFEHSLDPREPKLGSKPKTTKAAQVPVTSKVAVPTTQPQAPTTAPVVTSVKPTTSPAVLTTASPSSSSSSSSSSATSTTSIQTSSSTSLDPSSTSTTLSTSLQTSSSSTIATSSSAFNTLTTSTQVGSSSITVSSSTSIQLSTLSASAQLSLSSGSVSSTASSNTDLGSSTDGTRSVTTTSTSSQNSGSILSSSATNAVSESGTGTTAAAGTAITTSSQTSTPLSTSFTGTSTPSETGITASSTSISGTLTTSLTSTFTSSVNATSSATATATTFPLQRQKCAPGGGGKCSGTVCALGSAISDDLSTTNDAEDPNSPTTSAIAARGYPISFARRAFIDPTKDEDFQTIAKQQYVKDLSSFSKSDSKWVKFTTVKRSAVIDGLMGCSVVTIVSPTGFRSIHLWESPGFDKVTGELEIDPAGTLYSGDNKSFLKKRLAALSADLTASIKDAGEGARVHIMMPKHPKARTTWLYNKDEVYNWKSDSKMDHGKFDLTTKAVAPPKDVAEDIIAAVKEATGIEPQMCDYHPLQNANPKQPYRGRWVLQYDPKNTVGDTPHAVNIWCEEKSQFDGDKALTW